MTELRKNAYFQAFVEMADVVDSRKQLKRVILNGFLTDLRALYKQQAKLESANAQD